jgi:ATP adenylyltransferase
MRTIFAPWRMEYITSNKTSSCVFCEIVKEGIGEKSLIAYMGRFGYVVLNRYPYVSGHLMVIPYRHVEDPSLLSEEEWVGMNGLVIPTMNALKEIYHPQGFNIGMNVGQAAGAGIHEHVHIHVIPRWIGDNNLMAVIGETRVIPEALEETFAKVRRVFERLEQGQQI